MHNTPQNNPSRYLRYGSGAYRVLCYARFRKQDSFTSVDYRDFVLGNVSRKKLDADLIALSRIGYLDKRENPNPTATNTYGFAKYVYTITLIGQHALMVLGRNNRLQEEKARRHNMNTNGLERWRNQQKTLGSQIQNK